jgi:hypothetical protein
MPNNSLLDQIFSAKKEDVETFSEVFKKEGITDQESFRLKKTAEMKVESQKYITINHGKHEDNYVWHIQPTYPKKPWAVSIDKVLYAIGRVLNEYLPTDIMIDLHLPSSEWKIEEITVRANGALTHWAVTDAMLATVTGQFFEILNTLV